MCDYSSFSSIDKFPFPRTERSRAGLDATLATRAPSTLVPARALPGSRQPPAVASLTTIWSSQQITGGHFNNKEAKVNCFFSE